MALLNPSTAKKTNNFRLLFILSLTVGLFLFLSAYYQKYKTRILSFSEAPPNNKIESNFRTSVPVNIKIPDAGINLPLEESRIINGVWQISEGSASYLATSARPGENGNIVIYGHNKRNIFGKLIGRSLIGKQAAITSEDGQTHLYNINAIKTVDPGNISEVLPTDVEVLTLYTCTGIFDSKRLIIKAVPAK